MDYEKAKAENEFRNNPPKGAPGQGDDDSWDDIFETPPTQSSSAENTNLYNNDINQTLNNIQNKEGNQVQQPQQMQQKSTEDMLFEGSVVVGKGVWKYLKILGNSFKNNTKGDWHRLGEKGFKISAGGVIVGIIFCVVNVFRKTDNQPIDVIIGSLSAMFVSVGLLMFCEKDEEDKKSTEESEETNKPEPITSDDWGDLLEPDEFESEDTIEDSESYEEDYEEYEEDWDNFLEDEEYETYDSSSIESEDFDVEEVLDSSPEIDRGTQTRSYLYEMYMKVLPTINPAYNEMRQITKEETEFFDFEELLRSAAYQVGMKDYQIPELETIFENDFLFRLNCTRPTGLKEQAIADEIADTYSRDELNRKVLFGCYATVETSIGMYTINIFKGFREDSAGHQIGGVTVSLADIFKGTNVKNFLCDPSNQIPLVWGVSEFGDPYYCDMKANSSIIISGEPRGGKSWKGQSIVAQLAMFNSPKDIEFYFFDKKNYTSDYRYFSEVVPHAKYFCGDPDKINDGLERVINMVTNKYGKMLRDAGGKMKIEDYNAENPDNRIPYTYIVIDEIQPLMEYFAETDKEEISRFKGYLSTIVSHMANLGIRVILFPHRIVDSIISKNTYSLVSCRAVVRQREKDDLKNAVGATDKTFPYKLAAVGDMAVRVNEIRGGETVFCHAEILSSSNETNKKLYNYIGSLWQRLEPECQCITINGSIGGSIDTYSPSTGQSVSSTPARDNTAGEETFEYQGYDVGTDVETALGGMDDALGVDEDFWNNFG